MTELTHITSDNIPSFANTDDEYIGILVDDMMEDALHCDGGASSSTEGAISNSKEACFYLRWRIRLLLIIFFYFVGDLFLFFRTMSQTSPTISRRPSVLKFKAVECGG